MSRRRQMQERAASSLPVPRTCCLTWAKFGKSQQSRFKRQPTASLQMEGWDMICLKMKVELRMNVKKKRNSQPQGKRESSSASVFDTDINLGNEFIGGGQWEAEQVQQGACWSRGKNKIIERVENTVGGRRGNEIKGEHLWEEFHAPWRVKDDALHF